MAASHQAPRLRPAGVLALGLAAAAAISGVRVLTGPELALSLFYLLPIGAATWLAGARVGVAVSLVSAASWLAADLSMVEAYSGPWVPLVNEACRLAVFLLSTAVLARLRTSHRQLQRLATQDALTGIPNRRAFLRLARHELVRAQRYNLPFSLLFIDLDRFKQVNDTQGHAAGDILLRLVARALEGSVRKVDMVARLGGDEFAVLLPQAPPEAARQVARKLQRRLTALGERRRWPVSFCVGGVTYTSAPESVDAALRRADALMYAAKREGRGGLRHETVSAGG